MKFSKTLPTVLAGVISLTGVCIISFILVTFMLGEIRCSSLLGVIRLSIVWLPCFSSLTFLHFHWHCEDSRHSIERNLSAFKGWLDLLHWSAVWNVNLTIINFDMNVMVFDACNETNPNFFLLGLIYYVMWKRIHHTSENRNWKYNMNVITSQRWWKVVQVVVVPVCIVMNLFLWITKTREHKFSAT